MSANRRRRNGSPGDEPNGDAAASPPPRVTVDGPQTGRFLVSDRREFRLQGSSFGFNLQAWKGQLESGSVPNMRLRKKIRRGGKSRLSTLSALGGPPEELLEVEMAPELAQQLARQPGVIVEENRPLDYGSVMPGGWIGGYPRPVMHIPPMHMPPGAWPGHLPPQMLTQPPRQPARSNASLWTRPMGMSGRVQVSVTDPSGAPIQDAEVTLVGRNFPVVGKTDANGLAQVDLVSESADSVKILHVRAAKDFWDHVVENPQFADGAVPTVATRLQPLLGGQRGPYTNWGLRALGIDRLAGNVRGGGIRVGIIDSGLDASHPLFANTTIDGVSTVDGDGDGDGWKVDQLGHGTHCAGIIGGALDGQALRGVAPDSQLFIAKVFPGGRAADLVEAIYACIDAQVDVINMSLGNDQPSELVAEAIQEAREAGIVPIAAAGNSAGPVQFPALLPTVIAVSAIGKTGEFPEGSSHSDQVFNLGPASITPEGYFSAAFTCHGPEINLCAPGVAVISSVPGGSYAAKDGTSFAAPHVAGLAALLLAHHSDLADGGMSGETRADAVGQLLQRGVQPLSLGDPTRIGRGMATVSELVRGPSSLHPSSFRVAYPVPRFVGA